MEGLLPKLHGDDAVEIPGARALLDALIAAGAPWAIVTSGTEPLVTGWLDRLALPHPEVLVTAESVENGKPDPTCYNLGRSRLGLDGDSGEAESSSSKVGGRDGRGTGKGKGKGKGEILVLEDSPAGIRAGKAAGCRVLGLVTSHTAEQVVAAGPDWVVRDLRSVRLVGSQAGGGAAGGRAVVTLQISDALVTSS